MLLQTPTKPYAAQHQNRALLIFRGLAYLKKYLNLETAFLGWTNYFSLYGKVPFADAAQYGHIVDTVLGSMLHGCLLTAACERGGSLAAVLAA